MNSHAADTVEHQSSGQHLADGQAEVGAGLGDTALCAHNGPVWHPRPHSPARGPEFSSIRLLCSDRLAFYFLFRVPRAYGAQLTAVADVAEGNRFRQCNGISIGMTTTVNIARG